MRRLKIGSRETGLKLRVFGEGVDVSGMWRMGRVDVVSGKLDFLKKNISKQGVKKLKMYSNVGIL